MTIKIKMNQSEPTETERRYLWPWIVWPMAILFIVIAVVAVWFNVKKIERERDVNAPLPATAPVR